jgi:hypothetical protein
MGLNVVFRKLIAVMILPNAASDPAPVQEHDPALAFFFGIGRSGQL